MEVLRWCKFGGGATFGNIAWRYVGEYCNSACGRISLVRVRTHHLDGEKHISYHQSISVSLDPESRCNYCMRDGH